MVRAIQFILYENYYLLVSFTFDLSLLIKILVKDKVFEFETGHNAKNIIFVDLFACKSSKIRLESLLKKYQY